MQVLKKSKILNTHCVLTQLTQDPTTFSPLATM